MRWIKLFIWLIIIYESTTIFGSRQQLYFSSTQTDNRQTILERFFQKYHSPLNAKEFIEVADKYEIDFRLLPAIAMDESTLCKNYIYNCFGWNQDKAPASSETVAKGITSLSYYHEWQKDKSNIGKLAKIYNAGNPKKWEIDIRYFMERIK